MITIETTAPEFQEYDYHAEPLVSSDYAPGAPQLGKIHNDIYQKSLSTGFGLGAPVFWCSSEGSTIWQIKSQENDPFCKEAPSLFSKWSNLSLPIYSRIKNPVPVQKAERT
jgi:hypothetical protein